VVAIVAGEVHPVDGTLAEYILEVFTDSTASAFSSKRLGMVQGLLANLEAICKASVYIIESDVEKITVSTDAFADLLPLMVEAMRANQAYRDSVAPANTRYDLNVTVETKQEREAGQRGRKSTNYASCLALNHGHHVGRRPITSSLTVQTLSTLK
jgi:hypothetical protein